jgi:23S rRNA (uridine2552-2'-O)-methyltransferase
MARALLKKKRDVVVKSFQNPDLPQFKDEMEKYFDSVRIVKPPASRKKSSEVYLVGQGF